MTKKTLNTKKSLAKRTVLDLVVDLKNSGVDVLGLDEKLNAMDKTQIYSEIKDKDSDLFKSIASFIPTLSTSDSGKKYIEILNVFNKDFTLIPSIINTPRSVTFNSSPELPPILQELLANEDNSELMTLAQELMSNTELSSEIQNLQQMDMSNMMNLFQTVGNFVKDKTDSGQLDLEKLSSQANQMFSSLQTAPEIQNVLQENPQLDAILRTFSGVTDLD